MVLRKAGWGVMTFLAVGVAAYALANATAPGVRGGFVVDLVAEDGWRAVVHMAMGGIALIAGALQFSTAIRFERPRLHRRIGMVYVAMVVLSGVGGLLIATTATGGVPAEFGFGLLAVLWVGSALLAVRSARAGAYEMHRVWMIRSYALCLAAVTLRLYLPIFAIAGVQFPDSYPAIAWLCWVPNLVVAEWLVIPSSIAPLVPPEVVSGRGTV